MLDFWCLSASHLIFSNFSISSLPVWYPRNGRKNVGFWVLVFYLPFPGQPNRRRSFYLIVKQIPICSEVHQTLPSWLGAKKIEENYGFCVPFPWLWVGMLKFHFSLESNGAVKIHPVSELFCALPCFLGPWVLTKLRKRMGSFPFFLEFLNVLMYTYFLGNQTENRRLWTFKLRGMENLILFPFRCQEN